jgi:putative transposase
VYHYFREGNADGTWQKILDVLRPLARMQAGRALTPSAAAIDSQSVKTALRGKERRSTAAKRFKAASAISSWIPWAFCSPSW